MIHHIEIKCLILEPSRNLVLAPTINNFHEACSYFEHSITFYVRLIGLVNLTIISTKSSIMLSLCHMHLYS